MVAVGRVAEAPFERVADDAAPPRRGRIDPELRAPRAQMRMQIEVGHAGLDERVAERLVHLEDAVHAPQIDHDRAGQAGRRPAVGVVAAGRNGPQRQTIAARDAQHLPNFLDRSGQYGRGCREARLLRAGSEWIGVLGQFVVRYDDMRFADNRTEAAQRRSKTGCTALGRQHAHRVRHDGKRRVDLRGDDFIRPPRLRRNVAIFARPEAALDGSRQTSVCG